jgi:hypothetical protein
MGAGHGRPVEDDRDHKRPRTASAAYTGNYSDARVREFLVELLDPGIMTDLCDYVHKSLELTESVRSSKRRDADERNWIASHGGDFEPDVTRGGAISWNSRGFTDALQQWHTQRENTSLWTAMQNPAHGSIGYEVSRILVACLCAANAEQLRAIVTRGNFNLLLDSVFALRVIETRTGTLSAAEHAAARIKVAIDTALQEGLTEAVLPRLHEAIADAARTLPDPLPVEHSMESGVS